MTGSYPVAPSGSALAGSSGIFATAIATMRMGAMTVLDFQIEPHDAFCPLCVHAGPACRSWHSCWSGGIVLVVAGTGFEPVKLRDGYRTGLSATG
jgi:hypothetical protein